MCGDGNGTVRGKWWRWRFTSKGGVCACVDGMMKDTIRQEEEEPLHGPATSCRSSPASTENQWDGVIGIGEGGGIFIRSLIFFNTFFQSS